MNDPDVVVGIDPHADGLAEHPVIGKRLGPKRIDLEPGRHDAALGLRRDGFLERGLPNRKRA